MDELREVFRHMFNMQRVYFDCARIRLGNDMSVHPRQGPIMGLLLHNDGLSQADLMRRLNVTAATVAVSISRLEKLGYVRRERNERNQRANVLMLTEMGRAEARKLEAALREVQNVALDGFTEDELQSIEAYCGRMTKNLCAHYQLGEGKVHICEKC